MTLPVCRYRSPRTDDKHGCSSLFLFAPSSGVTGSFCGKCPYVDRVPSVEEEADLLRVREGMKAQRAATPPGPSATDRLSNCLHRSRRPLRDERGKVRLVAY